MKYDIDGINLNTKSILFSDNDIYLENERQIYEKLKILYAIDIYTLIVHKSKIKKMIRKSLAKRLDIDVSNIRYNNKRKKHEYTLTSGEKIFFDVLSEHLEKPSKDIIEELELKKRHGKCHIQSIVVGISIKDSIIQTGTIIVGNKKVLHSVVEIKNKAGDDIIIDWTRNLEIEKEKYIKLFNFNILSSIKLEEILNDSKFINGLGILTLNYYLTFREQITKDLNRNSFIFSEETNKVKKLSNSKQ